MGHYPVQHIVEWYEDGVHLTEVFRSHNATRAGDYLHEKKNSGVVFYYIQDQTSKRLVAQIANGKDIEKSLQDTFLKYALIEDEI